MQVQQHNTIPKPVYDGSIDSKLGFMSSKMMETRYYEGCGREGPIRCIFLGEFHPVAGPKIACQVSALEVACLVLFAYCCVVNMKEST